MIRIRDQQVDRAAYIIDDGEVADRLKEALDFAPQGRPRSLSLRTFLIGGLLAVEEKGSFKSTAIHEVLTEGISIAKQWELGVRSRDDDGQVQVLPKSRIDYLTKTITKRAVWTRSGIDHFDQDVDEDELERRRHKYQHALDGLLDGSIVGDSGGWYALDGSGHWSWGRSKDSPKGGTDVRAQEEVHDSPTTQVGDSHNETDVPDRVPDEVADSLDDADNNDGEPNPDDQALRETGHDFDAAWGKKTAKTGKRDWYFGYMIDAAIRISGPGQPDRPVVIERMIISPASTDVVAPSLRMLDSLLDAGQAVTDIVVDRHYSYKQTERWADELRPRGINQHFDLRDDEQGFTDLNGTKVVAGVPHCPATPDHLAEIPRPGPNASDEKKDEFDQLIAERSSWALDRHERVNANGRSRWTCPAMAGKRGCPLRDGTVEVAKQSGLPIVDTPPDITNETDKRMKCCRNDSGIVSLRSKWLRKHEQPHYWGTNDWKQAYNLRTYVEGLFGSLKNPDTEDVRRGYMKFVGLPLVTLGLALASAVCNVRHQRRFWEDRSDPPDHPLLAEDPPSHGWVELTEQEAAERDRQHGPDTEAA